jgi:hypothetical protein
MGQQRKLTEDQKQRINRACTDIAYMCDWSDTAKGKDYWLDVVGELLDMARHGTTDGKPWVEPEPAIPDGYRLAKDDEYWREDVNFWNSYANEWQLRVTHGTTFSNEDRYIVPIDRIPTDEEAMTRPRVMVRNRDDEAWKEAVLYGVDKTLIYSALAKIGMGTWRQWRQCRYPYEGE